MKPDSIHAAQINDSVGNVFPYRLQMLRNRRGISRRVLSELCGISSGMISVYEKGEVEPTASVIREIAQCLDVSADYLLGLKENF